MNKSTETPDLAALRALLKQHDKRRAGAPGPEDAAEKVARDLLAPGPDPAACDAVQEELPRYVDAELRGLQVSRQFPETHRHLLACQACGALHADLLELELGPALAPLPAPDLAALRWPVETADVLEFVRRRVKELVKHLNVPTPARFPALVNAFLERAAEDGERLWLQSQAAGAFRFDDPQSSQVLKILVATWGATMGVRDRLADGGARGRYRRAGFDEILRQAADEGVRRGGLRGREARRFTEAFIALAHPAEPPLPYTESEREP